MSSSDAPQIALHFESSVDGIFWIRLSKISDAAAARVRVELPGKTITIPTTGKKED